MPNRPSPERIRLINRSRLLAVIVLVAGMGAGVTMHSRVMETVFLFVGAAIIIGARIYAVRKYPTNA